MAAVQQYCLRWNNHQPNFISMFRSLLNSESLVDVTLAAEGKHLQAHKVVLSACSSYFQSLFTLNPCQHPIVILKDINYQDLKVMVDFMYCGEVNVSQEQLPAILKTAETLKVKGLAEMPESGYSLTQSVSVSSCDSPTQRRKRLRKASTGSASGSGSTEHTGTVTGGSEETVGSVEIGPTVKTETEVTLRHEPSTESEPSQDDDVHSVRSVYTYSNTRDIKHEKGSFESQLSTESYHSPLASPASVVAVEQVAGSSMGSKRGRLLIRQNRIKRECDGEDPGVGPPTPQPSPNPNLLTVPQPSYLVKQHSSPSLLLSNNPAPSSPITPTLQVQLVSPEAAPTPTPSIRVRTEELRRASSTPQSLSCGMAVAASEGVGTSRSCHCPVLRPGPALGCNFCWNTVDTHGRILRRKTKYHCPECQTNLCIVPCFQEYHERHNSSGGLDSTSVTGPVIPTIMKTSSMG